MAAKPLIYNPPPNWPKPPAGWIPQPGWTPDPGWGPAPDGWHLWVRPRGSKAGKIAILIGIVLLVVAGIAVAASGSGDKKTPAALGAPASQPTPAATTTTTDSPAPAAPTQKLTAGEENAIGSAQDYLSISGFSRKGLIQQLKVGDGYSTKDATFAADHVGANWNAQAVRSAKQYLSISHFSRSGLIQQLEVGDGYTKAQATYGTTKAGL